MTHYLSKSEIEKICEEDDLSDDAGDDDIFQEDVDDISDGELEHSDHDTESELEGDENEEEDEDNINLGRESGYFYGKNRFKWSKVAPATSRVKAHNIITFLPGIKGPAAEKQNLTPLDSWSLFITDEMIAYITIQTNHKITEILEKRTSDNVPSFLSLTNEVEIKALMGLLVLSGIYKSNHEDVRTLWATDGTGRNVFRAVMSLNRFLFLISALRFDEIQSRTERRETDRLALISYIFGKFIENCKSNYICSEYLTVDEMLVPFRGRCLFRVYMKSKPARYGIKIMCICDARTHYLYSAFIYQGKENTRDNKGVSIPTETVLRLASPLFGTNRNITGDNWFSSIELVDALKRNGLTYVGTMRKNKRDIPKEFLPNKSKSVQSSLFGFVRDTTLVSYVPKKNKSVILVSSMHHSAEVDPHSLKPEIIEFYNFAKGGVDALDQKCAVYSVLRRSRRWPTTIFGAIINITTTNSFLVWKAANIENKLRRRDFLKEVGISLVKPHVKERSKMSANFSRDLKLVIAQLLGEELENQPGPSQPKRSKSARCYICPRSKDVKTTKICYKCDKFICKMHSKELKVCTICEK